MFRKRRCCFPEVLPGVPARSPMYRELAGFLEGAAVPDQMPEHRRVDPAKARVTLGNNAAQFR